MDFFYFCYPHYLWEIGYILDMLFFTSSAKPSRFQVQRRGQRPDRCEIMHFQLGLQSLISVLLRTIRKPIGFYMFSKHVQCSFKFLFVGPIVFEANRRCQGLCQMPGPIETQRPVGGSGLSSGCYVVDRWENDRTKSWRHFWCIDVKKTWNI